MSYQRLFVTGRPAGDGSGSNSDLPDLLTLSSSSDCDDSDGSDSNSDALSDLLAMSSSSDCDDLDTDDPPPLGRALTSETPRPRRPPSRFDPAAPPKLSQLETNAVGASVRESPPRRGIASIGFGFLGTGPPHSLGSA